MTLYEERKKRTEWYTEARFGMFIHWGLYAIPARGEWVKSYDRFTNEEYQQYFDEFNPTRYNPKEWAKIAKNAGMKYAVLTAKHHDGFCLFDSQYTDYKSTNTKCKRDLVREYIDAFRAEGIMVGLYYSLIDWHHPDFPHYGDNQHPMRDNEAFKNTEHHFENYITYFHNQVRELLTNYGTIDILWFDFSYHNKALAGTQFEYMMGETWRATELVKMIRSLQPDVIIDNRLGGDSKKAEPEFYSGDFASPECMMPTNPITDELGRPMPWELCLTLDNNWGYAKHKPSNYKTTKNVIEMLVECVSMGGNMLINVGPNPKGEIPKESIRILSEVGEWMRKNAESIYGCTTSEFAIPRFGRYTQNDKMLYAHVYHRFTDAVCLPSLQNKVKKARLLEDGSELSIKRPWNAGESEDLYIDLGIPGLYDEIDTVIEVELL
ncbi:MAG TPA: alpha-L-fucosidase [Mobilitalea sp.]|nr:alpha-L-fucosidase [Mobilitalea sp.]